MRLRGKRQAERKAWLLNNEKKNDVIDCGHIACGYIVRLR